MVVVLLIASGIHAIFFLLLLRQWRGIPYYTFSDVDPVKVTVLIPTRNGEASLVRLLESIARQKYPRDMFEVLIVDDHSDRSVDLDLKDFNCEIRLIHLPESKVGKKAAATLGVKSALGDLVLCTDDDCVVPPDWISTYVSAMRTDDLVMVSGPVVFDEADAFAKIQSAEFAGLIAYGAITLQNGAPGMCNGANMAYRRDAFLAVDGYEGNSHIPSGDDEFLLQKITSAYPGKVGFLKSELVIVTTKAKETLGEYFNQRIRWISKWKFHKSAFIRLSAVLGFVDFAIACMIPVLVWWFPELVVAILMRWTAEMIYLMGVGSFFHPNQRKLWQTWVLVAVYPYYAVFLGLSSLFGRYSWKGRSY